jgi:hypothetical protein
VASEDPILTITTVGPIVDRRMYRLATTRPISRTETWMVRRWGAERLSMS